MSALPKAILLMGPTASGKTGVAMELTRHFPVELIGVDSAQALSAVFLFRLVTYWLPVPFGYFALRRIRGALED